MVVGKSALFVEQVMVYVKVVRVIRRIVFIFGHMWLRRIDHESGLRIIYDRSFPYIHGRINPMTFQMSLLPFLIDD